jgi:putative glutamine amidotransferase
LSQAVAGTYRLPTKKAFDYLKVEYYQAIVEAGGIPVLLPNVDDDDIIASYADSINGLLITGGGDIHPGYFGQEPHEKLGRISGARDNFEIKLIGLMRWKKAPLLGICRGHQVINVAFGGTLFQDLSCNPKRTKRHADTNQKGVYHKVMIQQNSRLFHIIGQSEIETNSSHHQVIDKLGSGLKASAYSSEDNIIEAIEHAEYPFVLGVQWHPEGIIEREHSKRIFQSFIDASRQS